MEWMTMAIVHGRDYVLKAEAERRLRLQFNRMLVFSGVLFLVGLIGGIIL
jgi:hypothetical protein